MKFIEQIDRTDVKEFTISSVYLTAYRYYETAVHFRGRWIVVAQENTIDAIKARHTFYVELLSSESADEIFDIVNRKTIKLK